MSDRAPSVQFRDEVEHGALGEAVIGDVQRPLSVWERISNISALRKLTVLVVMIVAWELYTRVGEISEYLLPTFTSTGVAWFHAVTVEGLLRMVWNSITVLLTGYVIGIAIAALLTTLAVATRFGPALWVFT